MSTADTSAPDAETHAPQTRDTGAPQARDGRSDGRMPGLVPVTETLRTVERHTWDPAREAVAVPARDSGTDAADGPRRARWAFWRLLGSELGLTFRRPRNLVMLAVLASVPAVLGLALRAFGGDDRDGMGGFIQSVAGNSLMLTFVAFSFLVLLLMPVAVSVVAGDSVAGEAGGGTLRYLLAAPAGRTRLLAVKYLNAVVFAYAVTAVVALSALVTGLILFPAGPVTLLSGTTISMGEGLLRILIAVGYVGAGMAALAAVALALSTFTEVSIGAVAATLVLVVVCQVLRAFPELSAVTPYLLPTRFTNFDAVLRSPMDLSALRDGLLAFGAYIVLFCSIAWARFSGKDITS
ncbi:ABC transporter permease [Nonomuraea sp. NPDC003560]|uniref:ABC transporter permease n=1 Tax=Nonomuraea sp. NPDC003560 TaxID=3364341 RepID=UPI003676989C